MWMRVVAAVAVLVSAAVHLKLWIDGVREQSVGPAFLLNAVAGVLIALLLVWRRDRVGPFLAVGFGLSTIGAFVVAATVGLFGVHERWAGGYVWTALVAEAVAVVSGALLLQRGRSPRSGGQLEHGPSVRRPHLH